MQRISKSLMNTDIIKYYNYGKPISRFVVSVIFMCLILIFPARSEAQLSYNAESMALGGGGTAYITGSEALFINPANLLLQDKDRDISITFLQGSSFWSGVNRTEGFKNYFEEFREVIKPFGSIDGFNPRTIQPEERDEFIERHFVNGHSTRTFNAQSELNWIGIKWAGSDKAYAFSLRTRIGNQFTLGRGLYSNEAIQKNNDLVVNSSFKQIYQIQHELSFGYSESFTFINGIQPGPTEFIIGIAPKLIIPGSGLNVNATNQYIYQPDQSNWKRETAYFQSSSGALTNQVTSDYRNFNSDPNQTPLLNQVSFNELLKPTGIGLGLDIGLTYLITFGDELSLINDAKRVINQSLRFSISVTDIGGTLINRDASEISTDYQTDESSRTGTVTDIIYQGSPNEHYFFLNQLGVQLPNQTGSTEVNQMYTMLPASIQTGALFQFNWFKIMGDASYSMVDSAYKPSGLVSYIGTEIRPFHFLPLRAGTRFGKNLPPLFSFGTGLETNGFDLNAAVMIQTDDFNSAPFTGNIVGASMLGVRIHL